MPPAEENTVLLWRTRDAFMSDGRRSLDVQVNAVARKGDEESVLRVVWGRVRILTIAFCDSADEIKGPWDTANWLGGYGDPFISSSLRACRNHFWRGVAGPVSRLITDAITVKMLGCGRSPMDDCIAPCLPRLNLVF